MKQSIITSVIMIAVITACLAACTVTTSPTGEQIKTVDQDAVNPWIDLLQAIIDNEQSKAVEIEPTK